MLDDPKSDGSNNSLYTRSPKVSRHLAIQRHPAVLGSAVAVDLLEKQAETIRGTLQRPSSEGPLVCRIRASASSQSLFLCSPTTQKKFKLVHKDQINILLLAQTDSCWGSHAEKL